MMKIFTNLSVISLLLAGVSASELTEADLTNGFLAGKLNVPGPYYAAEFAVNKFGTAVEFRDATIDSVRPKGDCLGGFMLVNDIAKVNVMCKSLNGSELNFEIDFKNISAKQLNSVAGVEVQVRSEATSGQWMPFKIRKLKKSFFEDTKN